MLKGFLYVLALLVGTAILTKSRSRGLRQGFLLIASYALYASWGVWFAAVLLASTVMNFLFGEWLRRKPHWLPLTLGIALNLSLLSTFKYLPEAAAGLPFSSLSRFAHVALPLGISFWTFQGMSYLFDLYRGEELDPSIFEFALFMALFPVVISGPICRMPEMLPQFRSDKTTAWRNVGHGLARIATGVLMMQLAKLLGQGILGGDGISSGFDRSVRWTGPDVWCLGFGYGLQLFFDFAGYSHIAIGAGEMLGFTLPENFARPLESTTPSIFWTRWHMSLSFWIRDYVFLPLAMLRRGTWWRNFVLVIAMVLFGVWHKATLLFVLWGCYHGVILVLHRQVQAVERRFDWTPPERSWTALSWVVTISLINLGWIFFRGNSISAVRQMLTAVITPATYGSHFLSGSLYLLVAGLAGGYAAVLLSIELLNGPSEESDGIRTGAVGAIARWRWYWLPAIYALALIFVLLITLTRGADTAQLMYRGF